MRRNFPRSKQKAIVKRFQGKARLAKSVDILVSWQNLTTNFKAKQKWIFSFAYTRGIRSVFHYQELLRDFHTRKCFRIYNITNISGGGEGGTTPILWHAFLSKQIELNTILPRFFQIFLDYMMFLRTLATKSNIKAGEQKSKTIQPHHVKDVLKVDWAYSCIWFREKIIRMSSIQRLYPLHCPTALSCRIFRTYDNLLARSWKEDKSTVGTRDQMLKLVCVETK